MGGYKRDSFGYKRVDGNTIKSKQYKKAKENKNYLSPIYIFVYNSQINN